LFGFRKGQFLHKLVGSVMDVFAGTYPELKDWAGFYDEQGTGISNIILGEEKRFLRTMGLGEIRLKEMISKSPKHISGKDAFFIYETYGFPFELIKEIANEKSIVVDEKGFEKAKEQARKLAQSKWSGSGKVDTFKFQPLDKEFPKTKFVGYDKLEVKTSIVGFIDENGKQIPENKLPKINQTCYLILKETPFYAESGGQIGDAGTITNYVGNIFAEVTDTQKFTENLVFHKAIIKSSTIHSELLVKAVVDDGRRKKIAQNHTATHLLNAALKEVLGNQTRQAGSYVSDKHFRFDYTASKVLSKQDLEKIQEFIKQAIKQNLKVTIEQKSLAEAKELGAVTLLGEKYSDPARFILINEDGFENSQNRLSLELCGGTHIKSTSEIKGIKILKDTALSSDVRRIEAVAGDSMMDYLNKTAELAESVAKKLKVGLQDLPKRIEQLLQQERKLKQEIAVLKQKLISGSSVDVNTCKVSNDIDFVWIKLDNADMAMLRNKADSLKQKYTNAVIFVISQTDKRISFILTIGKSLQTKNFDCAKIAKEISLQIKGSAGGRADFAQGGGNTPKNLDNFFSKTIDIIKSFNK
jgi:alanyl-tRNA synthetase